MFQLTDEALLKYIKSCEAELNTLAEYHRHLFQNDVICSIEELRHKIAMLYQDGYLGNEPTGDGVHMYYLIFYPDDNLPKV